jgi:hypothetical protein
MENKKIKFYDVADRVQGLTYDSDPTDRRLHYDSRDGNIIWSKKTKKEYQAVEKRIAKFKRTGNGWKVFTWCDVSGFEYWMENMEEDNYVQISVYFDTDEIDECELDKIADAVDDAHNEFCDLSSRLDTENY